MITHMCDEITAQSLYADNYRAYMLAEGLLLTRESTTQEAKVIGPTSAAVGPAHGCARTHLDRCQPEDLLLAGGMLMLIHCHCVMMSCCNTHITFLLLIAGKKLLCAVAVTD